MVGRFESGLITERKFAWGSIVFSSKYHITVITPFCTAVFHRWGAPHGHYTKSWRLFRQELLRRNLTNIYDVYKYANRYDITHFVKGTGVDLRSDETIKSEEEK
jgi:hypothetical protein